MTLELFARDWVPVISMGFGFMGLVSLGLVWYQIKLGTQWNKLQGQEKYLNRDLEDVEHKMSVRLQLLDIPYHTQEGPLSAGHVEGIWSDPETYMLVKRFLNAFEDLAAAVRIGFVDQDFAYALEGSRMIRTWRVFEPVIKRARKNASCDTFYIEMENVAESWSERRRMEGVERKKELQKHRKKMGLSAPKV